MRDEGGPGEGSGSARREGRAILMSMTLSARIAAFQGRHPVLYALAIALVCAVPYFALLHGFRQVPLFNEGTLLAPAEGVGPVLGLFFGAPGVVGCAVASVVSDVLCGYTAFGALAFRAIIELVYLALPLVLWCAALRGDPSPRPLLNSARKLSAYLVIAAATSLAAIGLNVLADVGLDGTGSVMGYTILALNDFVFLIYLGMPLLIALGQGPLPPMHPHLVALLLEEPRREEPWDPTRMNLTQRMVIAGVFGAVAVTIVLNVLYFLPYPFYQNYHEIMPDVISGAYALSAIFAVLIFVPTAIALQFLESHYTKPVEHVTEALATFLEQLRAGRRGQATIDMEGATPLNEVLDLVQMAERMQVSLVDHIDQLGVVLKERERVSAELDIARRIQMSVIPHEFSRFAALGLDVFGFMHPAREVGGDFFDVFDLGRGRVGLVIGDVSGKGVPAALFMMRALNALRSQMLACDDLGSVLTSVNAALYQDGELEVFVTALVSVVDTTTGRVRYANAGHMPPLVVRAGQGQAGPGEPQDAWLDCAPERVIGVSRAYRYTQREVRLAPGDGMLLYTDGVTDVADPDRAFFGMEGLAATVRKARWIAQSRRPGWPVMDARRVLEFVANQVELFSVGAPQADDMTMLAFSWQPAAAGTPALGAAWADATSGRPEVAVKPVEPLPAGAPAQPAGEASVRPAAPVGAAPIGRGEG